MELDHQNSPPITAKHLWTWVFLLSFVCSVSPLAKDLSLKDSCVPLPKSLLLSPFSLHTTTVVWCVSSFTRWNRFAWREHISRAIMTGEEAWFEFQFPASTMASMRRGACLPCGGDIRNGMRGKKGEKENNRNGIPWIFVEPFNIFLGWFVSPLMLLLLLLLLRFVGSGGVSVCNPRGYFLSRAGSFGPLICPNCQCSCTLSVSRFMLLPEKNALVTEIALIPCRGWVQFKNNLPSPRKLKANWSRTRPGSSKVVARSRFAVSFLSAVALNSCDVLFLQAANKQKKTGK